jgi:hypothetical protein
MFCFKKVKRRKRPERKGRGLPKKLNIIYIYILIFNNLTDKNFLNFK